MWAYESKKRWRTSTFSFKGNPPGGHVVFKFRMVAALRPPTRVSLGATWPRWGGQARTGVYVMADPRGLVRLRSSRRNRVGIRFEEQGALSWMIRKRPARGLMVADMPTGTVDVTTPPTLRTNTTAPVKRSPPSCRGQFPRLNAALTRPVDGETARALHRGLVVVPVAVALVLLATVRPTGGHAGLVEEDFTDATSAHELKKLLQLAGRDPGVVAGPLANRVAVGHHGVTQAGHQGPRGVAAELPGVASSNSRQPLGNAIRGHVVQLVESRVGNFAVLHGVERDDVSTQGVTRRGRGRRGRLRGTRGGQSRGGGHHG